MVNAKMTKKKTLKDEFKEFRHHDKSAYTTIKIPLRSLLLNHKVVQPVLNHLVFDMNDLVIHTYQFIRLYVLTCFSNQTDLPVVDEPFVLYCLRVLGTRDNRGRHAANVGLLERLETFYNAEYQPLVHHEKTDLKNKTFLLPYLATQIHTSLSNNAQERFIQHFLRFVNKTTTNLTDDKATLFQFKHHVLSLQHDETDVRFNDWKATHLPHILPSNVTKSVYYDVKAHPMNYVKGMLYMNEVLETGGWYKLFQPLPLRNNIIPKHIILDTAGLVSLFCPENTKKADLLKNITANQADIWNNFLNLKHPLFKNTHYQFHHQIQTDGISCSLLFIRKDLQDKKWGTRVPTIGEQNFYNMEDLSREQLDGLKGRNIVGCDPGKKSLVYMMDETGKKLQYTAQQRKIESYGKRNQRILGQMKKKHNISEKETLLSLENSKTVDVEKFKRYLVEKTQLNQEVGAFYKRDVWRKMKFRQYSYGKKSIDTFLDKIQATFGDNVLIGYGNWSRDTQMKHFMPTMNQGLRKQIHKRFDTITINEFNTSKLCCDCSQELTHYKDKKNTEVYRLFCCVSCPNKKIVFRTRDANSAVNIRKLTRSWIETQTRPGAFSRKQGLSPVLAKTGKRKTIVVKTTSMDKHNC